LKLLIADTLPQLHVETLRKIVGEVEYDPDLMDESLVDRIRGAKISVVRGTNDSAQAIESISNRKTEIISLRVQYEGCYAGFS
jgi:hypothetical protein